MNTGSQECISLGKKWLNACIRGHESCGWPRDVSNEAWKPTRLLYVGTDNDTQLRLCERHEIPIGVRYTTLSHCWGANVNGQTDRITLTIRNHTTWIKSINMNDMMQTFKDAIRVTRGLGLEFLWIDSMCIIQDSKDDWLHESSLMSNVYKYAYCGIAATAAPSDGEGCFLDRIPRADLPIQFDFSDIPKTGLGSDTIGGLVEIEVEEKINTKPLNGPYHIQWGDQSARELEGKDAPLVRRGWAFQEV